MTNEPKRYMTYEEYLQNIRQGIVTKDGRCPVTPLLLMLQGRWKSQLMYEMCIYDTVRTAAPFPLTLDESIEAVKFSHLMKKTSPYWK